MISTHSIRQRLGLPALADDPVAINGVANLDEAGPSDLCFAEQASRLADVSASGAVAIIVPEDFPDVPGKILIRVAQPRDAFFSIAESFLPPPEQEALHPAASIDPSAVLSDGVTVGACAVISAAVTIGEGSIIGPGAFLGSGVTLGRDCLVGANVSVLRDTSVGDRCILHPGSVLGADGFGFRWTGACHRKLPQLGRVVVEDDVEIGCNVCIDRATLGVTRVCRGTKIDNLVQVAHNVRIGKHCILVSQSGVAGSSRLEDGVVLAGQVAISDHVTIGAGAQIGGQAGVTRNVAPGTVMFGTPARPLKQTLREQAALARLSDLLKQVRAQQRQIDRLAGELDGLRASSRDYD